MKSRALYGKKNLDLQIRELELSEPGANDVLVKVHACGVCGTDLNFIRDWEGDYQSLGHEIAGEVVETGKNVTAVKRGDRVIVEDCTMCGKCPDCKSGHPELCRNMYTLNGQPGMSEYMVVNENSLNLFTGLDYVPAALTEPLAVAYNAVLSADLPMRGSVVVLGPGPIGLLCAKLCRLHGCGYLGITSRTAQTESQKVRVALSGTLGCDEVILTDDPDWKEKFFSRHPNGVDRVIVTSPPKSMKDALEIIRYGGTIVYLGLSFKPGENIIDFDINHAIFNKITLKPSFAEPAINFPASLELIKNGLIPAELFQTHLCNFDNCREIFGQVLRGELPVIKPVFTPWD